MAFDAFYMSCVLEEVRALGECRVEKIHQPSRDTVILLLKHKEGRAKLLIAANPAAPRLHLTTASPENPAEPPMFCMLLRKHIGSARLVAVNQLPMERCAEFVFDCIDEMGDAVQKRLVAELMGKTCNLYLLGADGRIIDCLRRIGLDAGAKRTALPGMYYQNPDPVEKMRPQDASMADLLAAPGADLLADRLMDHLGGLSPLICREAALFAAGDTDARIDGCDMAAVAEKLTLFFTQYLTRPIPSYYAQADGTPKQFAFCPICQYGAYKTAEGFSALLDMYYTVRDRKDALRQKGQAMRKTVNNLCQRLERKLAIQEKELAATYDRERLRQLGDILMANIHSIQKGQKVARCQDFYDENMALIDIPLSVELSPQQNAAKFYKDYTRMKNAEAMLTHQIALGETELVYLRSVLEELNRADSEQALEEIRQELQEGGYVKSDGSKRKMKQSKLSPMRFVSTDGYPIYVGRNNKQNDELTFKMARKDDLWFHASKVHGSHVIVACAGVTPPDNTITQAAQLAAYYAETGSGQNIPVDMTPVKQVKKIPNGKPGMVIYHSYKTVIANPYPDIVLDALNAE